MSPTTVYYTPLSRANRNLLPVVGRTLLERLVSDSRTTLLQELPIKVHSGEPGNVTFLRPATFTEIITYLHSHHIQPYFIETNTASGIRSRESSHLEVARRHGFTQIPFVIADGADGFDHREVPIGSGKHFKSCKIATKLAQSEQVLVTSHFKGHIMTGFGGTLKQLGLGFASGRGKTELHSKIRIPDDKQIDWNITNHRDAHDQVVWHDEVVYHSEEFVERMAEYALAAVKDKDNIYITYAIDMTQNCDCDGHAMQPIYDDLGVFASTNPVALDKAIMDMLANREGKQPFEDFAVFEYAEALGIGSSSYQLTLVN